MLELLSVEAFIHSPHEQPSGCASGAGERADRQNLLLSRRGNGVKLMNRSSSLGNAKGDRKMGSRLSSRIVCINVEGSVWHVE